METKFTRGPWALDERIGCTVVAGDTVICSTRATHNGRRDPEEQEAEYQANANLIAASPLLYEALEAFDKLLLFDSPIDSSTAFVIEGNNKELLAAIELGRNALRAARGEE